MKIQLNSNHLKIVAILAMTIDHITDLVYPGFSNNPIAIVLHLFGRLTAPIMWFFICEGFYYTKNLKKYLARMLGFAVVSHFAYCFAFGISYVPFSDGVFNQTSVMWSLFWAIVVLWLFNGENKLKEWQKYLLLILINIITFPADWSCIAVMAIASMYSNRNTLKKQMKGMMFWVLVYSIVSFFFVNKTYAIVQLGVIMVYPFLKHYNGKKGNMKWLKWFFYLYYPAHLIIVGILRIIIYGDVPILF